MYQCGNWEETTGCQSESFLMLLVHRFCQDNKHIYGYKKHAKNNEKSPTSDTIIIFIVPLEKPKGRDQIIQERNLDCSNTPVSCQL